MGSILLTVIAIGIASNLDNAGVGIAYGIRKIRIAAWANLLISLISGVATLVAGLLGRVVSHYVPTWASTWTGAIVIFLVGVWVFTDPFRHRTRQPESANVMSRILQDPVAADFDGSQSIGLSEALVLGIALAINALAGGFDAGVSHIGVYVTAFAVAAFGYVLLALSALVGRRFAAETLGNKATYIAGIILMLIGLHQVW